MGDDGVVLAMMRYLVSIEGANLFDTILLELCQSANPKFLEEVLKINPPKTLEVGYLEVRQLAMNNDITDKQLEARLKPWLTCLTLLKQDS